jgi:hypothetical protein
VATVPVHAACGKEWAGARAAHCGGCHETFSGVTLFDAHRSLKGGEHGSCADPATMAGVELRDGVWSYPEMSADARAKVARR